MLKEVPQKLKKELKFDVIKNKKMQNHQPLYGNWKGLSFYFNQAFLFLFK